MNHAKKISLLFFLISLLSVPELLYSAQAKPQQTKEFGKIVFSSYMNESWQIWSVHPDGNNLMKLTGIAQDIHYPAVSPDGNKLAFANNEGEIWVMEKSKKTEKILKTPENCTHPVWSPDGSKIAFVCYFFINRKEDSDIWIADLKQERVWKLMKQEGIQSYPAWSPDGATIVYTTGYRISSNKIIEELWLVNSDGTNPGRLVADRFSNIQPDWSPDGKKIAFASDRSGNMEIWVVDRNGKNMRQLTRDKSYDADPNWSPDGSKICFTSTRSGKMDIWIMDIDGENTRQLTGLSDLYGESKEPDWSYLKN